MWIFAIYFMTNHSMIFDKTCLCSLRQIKINSSNFIVYNDYVVQHTRRFSGGRIWYYSSCAVSTDVALGVYPSQNIQLGFDILWISITINELFNYQLVFKSNNEISENIGTHLNCINTYLTNALTKNAWVNGRLDPFFVMFSLISLSN